MCVCDKEALVIVKSFLNPKELNPWSCVIIPDRRQASLCGSISQRLLGNITACAGKSCRKLVLAAGDRPEQQLPSGIGFKLWKTPMWPIKLCSNTNINSTKDIHLFLLSLLHFLLFLHLLVTLVRIMSYYAVHV